VNAAARRVSVAGAVVVVLSIVSVAVVIWRTNDRTAGPQNPGQACPPVVAARGRPLLAAPGVHRVMLVGDSIMQQASCAVADSLAGLGITTSRRAVPGTGLLTGMDWVTTLRGLLAAEHPDAVIAVFVGNYLGSPIRDAQGNVIAKDTPAFRTAWQARAEQLSHVVRQAGADMYWVSPPPFAFPPFQGAAALYAGYRTISGDHFLDAGRSLADAHGREVASTTTCGARRVVRAEDVAHLTDDGARIYGQTIARDFGRSVGPRTSPKPC
jgi:hypothetical protein